jgi:type II secretory pathway pseudopilin PulG
MTTTSGFTLIELLAIAVILAFVASISFHFFARRSESEISAQLASKLQQFEHNCRQTVLGYGGAIALDDSSWHLEQDSGSSGSPNAQLALGDVKVVLSDPFGRQFKRLSIDTRGRSSDFIVTVRMGNHERMYSVLGLTGEWNQVAPVPSSNGAFP